MPEDYAKLTDAQLIRRVKDGEPEAFVELSSRYLWLVRAKAGQFSGPAAPEKEDLFQEGLMGLYAAALSYEPEAGASFGTYSGVCVYNRMVSAARRHASAGNRTLNESLPLETAGEVPVTAGGPQDLLEIQESYRGMLERVESSLTALERRALALYLSGCRREEVPEKAGMPLKTFDNAMHRVRRKLKR